MKNSTGSERKEVVIIGNGPSAITLSYFLAGNWPVYPGEGHRIHPNEYLHKRLSEENLRIDETKEILEPGRVSLVQQDLAYLCNGLEGRSINPVSVLMDTLQHPDADFGCEAESCLEWKSVPHREVDHVVLGQGSPGGTWNRMEDCDDTLTVSVASWMSLPDLPFNEWNNSNNNVTATKEGRRGSGEGRRGSRVGLGNVSRYYREYVKLKGLEKYFEDNSLVTKLSYDEHASLWQVSGWKESSGPFDYFTPRVVLATGNSDSPNRLDIPGEDLPFVFHSINDLEHILSQFKPRRRSTTSGVRSPRDQPRILIVGAGLTAADAIITCQNHGIEVVHAFRKHPDDPSLIFNQLPENMYPEYHEIHSQMKDINPISNNNKKECTSGYKAFPMHSVVEIRKKKEVVLKNLITSVHESDSKKLPHSPSINISLKVSHVLVLIGKRADLSFIKSPAIKEHLPLFPDEPLNPRNNPIRIDPFTHECISSPHPGLFAMGPLVGDNFVRFLQGAALAICNHFWKTGTSIARTTSRTSSSSSNLTNS